VLKAVKDWIAADFETWDKVLNNKDEGSYRITVSGEEAKNKDQKRIKKYGEIGVLKIHRKRLSFDYCCYVFYLNR
jgi:hypothetical protein